MFNVSYVTTIRFNATNERTVFLIGNLPYGSTLFYAYGKNEGYKEEAILTPDNNSFYNFIAPSNAFMEIILQPNQFYTVSAMSLGKKACLDGIFISNDPLINCQELQLSKSSQLCFLIGSPFSSIITFEASSTFSSSDFMNDRCGGSNFISSSPFIFQQFEACPNSTGEFNARFNTSNEEFDRFLYVNATPSDENYIKPNYSIFAMGKLTPTPAPEYHGPISTVTIVAIA